MVSVVSCGTLQTGALAWSSRWLRPHASIVISTRNISKDFGAKNGLAPNLHQKVELAGSH